MALLVGLRREAVAERHLLPEALRLIRQHARAADLVVEQAARRQRGVADHLGRQAEARPAREQPVLGILLEQRRRRLRRLAVGRRRHDQPLHRPDVPAGADELGRQPVEQLRMHRRLALHAEVFLRLDDAVAEVHLPEPVDRDARGERMLRDRRATCASVRRLSGAPSRQRRQHRRHAGLRPSRSGCGSRRAPSTKRVARLLHLRHDHRGRDRLLRAPRFCCRSACSFA